MKYLCTSQNACFSTRAIVNLAVGASICHIFFRQFWPLKKPIARTLVTSTLRNNDSKRESISLLQIFRKMVRNYFGNFTTFNYLSFSDRNFSIEIKPAINALS